MNKDKQIEEMAKALGDGRMTNCSYYESCSACPCDFNCIFQENAQILLNAGYRKASEIARDIFGNLRILGHIDFNGNICIRKDSFAELEKIYTEGENNDG